MTSIAGYEIEPAAHIDMGELRYQWFDYALRKGPKPAILADKVNYEVVSANAWKHAPSIAAMSNGKLRVPFTEVTQTVNLAHRSDVDQPAVGGNVIDKAIDTSNAVKFVSDPIQAPAEASGLFAGHLDFIANKKDFDFQITLYELTSAGDYVVLAPYWSRASYVGHPSERRLLTPGKRQRLDFRAILPHEPAAPARQPDRRPARRHQGDREADQLRNGARMSARTIKDAGEPLRIQWFANSYVDVPVSR